MGNFNIEKIEQFPGLMTIVNDKFDDNRGYFQEIYKYSKLLTIEDMVQWNHSFSEEGVFRGLHFQWNPHMGKFVRCLTGSIVDMVLDIRKDSPSYGKVYKIVLDKPEIGFWVPPGFAHGFLAMQDSHVLYGCSGEYSSGHESAISWNDSNVDINLESWFNLTELKITAKDNTAMTLRDWEKTKESENFIFEELYRG